MWIPSWKTLQNGEGIHLTFGNFHTKAPPPWVTVDIVEDPDIRLDLIKSPWPWDTEEVAAIQCVGMLYQWPIHEVVPFLGKCLDILKPSGILWVGSSERATNYYGREYASYYTEEFLYVLLHNVGFHDITSADTLVVGGRKQCERDHEIFAFRCAKEEPNSA